jgi:hypothetical protein
MRSDSSRFPRNSNACFARKQTAIEDWNRSQFFIDYIKTIIWCQLLTPEVEVAAARRSEKKTLRAWDRRKRIEDMWRKIALARASAVAQRTRATGVRESIRPEVIGCRKRQRHGRARTAPRGVTALSKGCVRLHEDAISLQGTHMH